MSLWTGEFVYEISGWWGIIHAANTITRFVQKMDTLDEGEAGLERIHRASDFRFDLPESYDELMEWIRTGKARLAKDIPGFGEQT
jgi:hypothetical protein